MVVISEPEPTFSATYPAVPLSTEIPTVVACQLSLQNQPPIIESKPATFFDGLSVG
jgi:hypothetical protein